MKEASSPLPRTEIPNADWEQTPMSVKQWVESREERIQELEQQLTTHQKLLAELQAQIQLLQEKQNRTSSNSSQPPRENLLTKRDSPVLKDICQRHSLTV